MRMHPFMIRLWRDTAGSMMMDYGVIAMMLSIGAVMLAIRLTTGAPIN